LSSDHPFIVPWPGPSCWWAWWKLSPLRWQALGDSLAEQLAGITPLAASAAWTGEHLIFRRGERHRAEHPELEIRNAPPVPLDAALGFVCLRWHLEAAPADWDPAIQTNAGPACRTAALQLPSGEALDSP